jgi:NAD(P)-dependent dehydrogenase (short-subunit alcohol dehydrogenase family)
LPKLQGKTAIITGATGGIGAATAKLFLAEGANVMLVGRSAEKLKATREALAADKCVACSTADATDEQATAAAVAATIETFGGVDILLANAGTEGRVSPLDAISMADFEQVLHTNVLGVWLAMRHCVEPMKRRGAGLIIAMASMAGLIGVAGFAPYIASKHAVIGLMKSAALELGPFGIRVNAIAPGPIDNRMVHSLESQFSPENPSATADGLKAQIALGRYGTNEEVAKMALFLASDGSSFSTGGVFMMDGGYTAA